MAALTAPIPIPSGGISAAINKPALEELERTLDAAYQNLLLHYGITQASQAVGKLLAGVRLQPEQPSYPTTETLEPVPSPRSEVGGSFTERRGLHHLSSDLHGEDTKSEGSRSPGGFLSTTPTGGKAMKWLRALDKAALKEDPWVQRQLHLLPMEHAVRHRYNARTRDWVVDDVLVRMEGKPFAAGAMRECYAMKQLSTFGSAINHDWRKASNSVAKKYKKEVEREVYFTDVLVQMEAKMLGEEYNATRPPKQVDVMQCAIIEMRNRSQAELLCVERLIEGDYVKYNSNSGFVMGQDDVLRHTPQAFSHFTFELTKGRRICVDIQGVGDLYTDPQIHTLDGEGFGEGNLGLRGIALFFRTHECNDLCRRLKLRPFDRCRSDINAQGYHSESSSSSVGLGLVGRQGTMSRSAARYSAERRKAMMLLARNRSAEVAEVMGNTQELMAALKLVPKEEEPECLVHMEVAKVYAEVVLLPELRPAEDPEDALKGGLFHLQAAALHGCVHALCLLARVHCDLEPTTTQFAHLIKVAKQRKDIEVNRALALEYARLAAERGVYAATAAVAYAYTTGGGLGDGIMDGPQPSLAVQWLERLLALQARAAAEAEGALSPGKARPHATIFEDEELMGDADFAAFAVGGEGSITSPRDARQPSRLPDGTRTVSMTAVKVGQRYDDMDKGEVVSAVLRQQLRTAAEEEAQGLPGGFMQHYEALASLAGLLHHGGPGLRKDPARAAELYNEAADAATEALKAKLAAKYYELAAVAEGEAEEEEGEQEDSKEGEAA